MIVVRKISILCIVALIVVLVSGCMADLTAPDNTGPVQPIKRRPITPDGKILRPRLVENGGNIRLLYGDELSKRPALLQLYTLEGELLFDDVIQPNDMIEFDPSLVSPIFVVDGEQVDISAKLY